MGVACIADDILIYGIGDTLDEARQDHDKNLSLLLERCRQKSVKLNRDKVVLRVQQVDFMGHLLTAQGLKPDPNKVEAILKLETPGPRKKLRDRMALLTTLLNSCQDLPKSWIHLGD